jgi:phosphatidylglycerophosphatase A
VSPPARWLVTGLGTGYLPGAPGTWGSLPPAVLFGVLATVGASALPLALGMAGLAVACTLACGALGRQAEAYFGRKDPRPVTLDEWAGQAAALVGIPTAVPGLVPAAGAAVAAGIAFVCFRAFDIFKPPPARQLEKLPHGWGVAADDLAAGLYANFIAQLVLRWGLGA